MSDILRVQNVSKTYEDNAVQALRHASFNVHEGELISVIGPSEMCIRDRLIAEYLILVTEQMQIRFLCLLIILLIQVITGQGQVDLIVIQMVIF